MHRKKAKVVFRNDPLSLTQLEISGSLSQTYIKWLEGVKKFYAVALADGNIQTALSELKITEDELNDANTLITELQAARAEYLKEKGESQGHHKA